MGNSLDEKIVEFLSDKRNLASSLEVGRFYDQVQKKACEAFWGALRGKLEKVVLKPLKSELSEWQLEENPWERKYDYVGLDFVPRNVTENATYLKYCIEQGWDEKHLLLYLGLAWEKPFPPDHYIHTIREVRDLKGKFGSNYKIDEPGKAWLAWTQILDVSDTNSLLVRYAEQRESLIEEVVTIFKPLVQRTRVLSEEINEKARGGAR